MQEARAPLPPSQVSVKTVLTVAVTLFGLVVLSYLVVKARTALVLIAVSALLAIALKHVVERLVRAHVRRGLAIAVVMLGVLVVWAGIGLLLVPPVAKQVGAFVEAAPRYLQDIRASNLYRAIDQRVNIDARIQSLAQTLPSHLQNYANVVVAALTGLLSFVGGAVTIFFLTIFMLAFGEDLAHRWLSETVPERRPMYAALTHQIYESIGGYIGGLAFVCLVNASFTTAFLAIIGNPYFLPLGILSGLSSLVPMVGNTVAGILITLVSWATGGFWRAVATAIYYVTYQQFENHVLGPVIYRKTVDLNPLVIILALLVFGELFGILGVVLAIPAVAIAQIIVREFLALRRERLGLARRNA